jgi:hypothetical protein
MKMYRLMLIKILIMEKTNEDNTITYNKFF